MILDELIVHDFGLYADRQKICLTPPTADKPIILFGGLNGHGKTTLLDALQLCLYGPFAKISNRNELSYQDYLSRCIYRNSITREAAIEIAFRHTVDGKEDHYRLYRSWHKRKSGCRENFEVLKNRRREDTLAENWISYVENIFPAIISSLFLFDGEQIEKYASLDNSMNLIRTAIRNLLGLDVVDRLEKDLITYSRRKRAENKNDPKHDEIEKAETNLKEIQIQIHDLKQKQAGLKTNLLDRARKSLHSVENEYRELGGELYDQRVEIESELVTTELIVEEKAKRLREYATGDLPLVLVRKLLKAIRDQDLIDEQTRNSRKVTEMLKPRDEIILSQMDLLGVDKSIVKKLHIFLKEDRCQHRSIGKRRTVLNVTPPVRNLLDLQLNYRLDELVKDVKSELEESRRVENIAEHVRFKHSSIPNQDTVLELINRRNALLEEIASLEKQYTDLSEEINRLTRQRERSEQSVLRMIESDLQVEGERQDRARILRHASRVRSTLEAFSRVVIARHVHRIGQLVLESYQQLLRKKSLVTGLEINPETFNLTLYGRDRQKLTTERLSAGERQLLAISLLWGLAKASGRALPTAIDTPLGRLDSGHRNFLVERYFPFASHQVLLFSTDEEIIGKNFDALKPFVGRSYFLCHDDSTGSTKILEGYFDQLEAA